MLQLLCLAVFGIMSGCAERRSYTNYIAVSNGGAWGDWGEVEFCPQGQFAIGFALKVEGNQGGKDDTALNGIRLFCSGSPQLSIESRSQRWGSWTPVSQCYGGVLKSFVLKVEPKQGLGDDTAANNIMFRCSTGVTIEGNGAQWGTYGGPSASCEHGICGIQTKTEKEQPSLADDTGLNDVRFYCCSF